MNNKTILYEDQYFYITKCSEFPNVPGFMTIYAKGGDTWYYSEDSIKRLALIEKTIREEFMELGFELAGIYREEYDDNRFRILIIPYSIELLKQNNISPDFYQPFIRRYLESFGQKNSISDNVTKKILMKLEGGHFNDK